MIGLLTVLAHCPYQPLGHDAKNGIGKIKGIHPHVQQTGNALRGAVRVKRRKNQMAS